MPTINSLGSSTGSTPSVQPQTQAQGLANPGLNANQISLAAPPANFAQGKRFFITENNGNYQLTTVRTDNRQALTAPNANPALPADALEVNASIAYAITTGTLNPATYMAQYNAQSLRLNDAVKAVGASPLQTPSLAGEITGDQFDASAILQFLKKSKGEFDDSNTQADLSAHGENLISQTVFANLNQALVTYDSDNTQINSLQSQLRTENAKSHPDPNTINNLNNQISSLQADAANAKSTILGIGNSIFSDASKGGINAIRKDVDKLNKEQLNKLSKVVTDSVTKSISDQIDKSLLGDNPTGNPNASPLVKTADGTVIKTPETQAKEAVLEQLQSKEFQDNLTQSIIDNADALGLGDLSPEDLKSVATALALEVSNGIASDPTIIDDAINNTDALQSDVTNILTLELEGQSGRNAPPNNV